MTDPELEGRLKQLEQKLDDLVKKVDGIAADNKTLSERILGCIKDIAVTDSRAKSAHHRLDDMWKFVFWSTGMAATIVGIFATVLTAYLGR